MKKNDSILDQATLRRFARSGAFDQALRIVTEFPDILEDLNKRARAIVADTIDEAPKRALAHAQHRRKTAWTPAKRRAHSMMMKRRWAAKRQEA